MIAVWQALFLSISGSPSLPQGPLETSNKHTCLLSKQAFWPSALSLESFPNPSTGSTEQQLLWVRSISRELILRAAPLGDLACFFMMQGPLCRLLHISALRQHTYIHKIKWISFLKMQDTTRCDGMYPHSSTLEAGKKSMGLWYLKIHRENNELHFFLKKIESGVIPDYSFSTWEMRLEDQELKSKLSYIAHLRLAWTICGLTKR